MIDEDDLLPEISFHAPKEEFVTAGGIVIQKGDPSGQ
jgi:hypothetical protein